MLTWVAVGAVGGIGAILRFVVDGAVSERAGSRLPWGTFAVNISGSFALGALDGASVGGDALLIAGVGLVGAYTTFSTWLFETHRLGEEGQPAGLALNLAGSLVAGIAAVALGHLVGGAL